MTPNAAQAAYKTELNNLNEHQTICRVYSSSNFLQRDRFLRFNQFQAIKSLQHENTRAFSWSLLRFLPVPEHQSSAVPLHPAILIISHVYMILHISRNNLLYIMQHVIVV